MSSDDDRPLQSFARTALRGPRAIRSLSPHSEQIVAVFSGMCENVSAHGLDFEPMGNFLAQKRGILGMDPAPSAVRRQETLHGVAKMQWSWSDSGLIPTVTQIAESLLTRTASYAVCLLQLQELFAAGLSALYADQLEAYYKAILIVASKDLVLPGQKHQWYTAMIKGQPLPEPTEPRAK